MRRLSSDIGMPSRLCLLLLPVLAVATPATGQVRIDGRVIDDVTEQPLSLAEVTLLTHDDRFISRKETDDAGRFEFNVDRARAVRLKVRRFSYQQNTTPVLRFNERTFFQVEVRLDADAILLAPLEVVAWSRVDPSPFLDNFRRRLETGQGVYITRDQIEARKPLSVSDLLRDVPGITVAGGGAGLQPAVRMSRSLASGCATQIWVDGFLLNRRRTGGGGNIDFRLDDAVSPAAVEAIEIYRGLSTVPGEFLNPDAACGVIAIWTRRGGRG